jgi:hypothetical protein
VPPDVLAPLEEFVPLEVLLVPSAPNASMGVKLATRAAIISGAMIFFINVFMIFSPYIYFGRNLAKVCLIAATLTFADKKRAPEPKPRGALDILRICA